MLKKLIVFDHEFTFSKIFFQYFDELLEMKLVDFNDYLQTCYFQTTQMRKIQYLNLKD